MFTSPMFLWWFFELYAYIANWCFKRQVLQIKPWDKSFGSLSLPLSAFISFQLDTDSRHRSFNIGALEFSHQRQILNAGKREIFLVFGQKFDLCIRYREIFHWSEFIFISRKLGITQNREKGVLMHCARLWKFFYIDRCI